MLTNNDTGEIVLYNTDDGKVKINLRAIDDTVWLSQGEMAELFDKGRTTITEHIQNIISEGELDAEVVCRKFRHTTQHGAMAEKTQENNTNFYSLEMILAVGFRVKSARGTQFRKWASTILQEYLVKGFAMDDDKLKQSDGWDYFDEWLARIRDIRASEKRFYQKISDLYITAEDYDGKSELARDFFAKVQNKMCWAVTGQTAAELVKKRSNPELQNMGLTSWQGAIVRKGDVHISKNYLTEDEVQKLNLIVTMYLDYAELQAEKRKTVSMEQWSDKLDSFLTFNEQDVLTHAGTVRAAVAKKLAEERFEEFDTSRKQKDAITADDIDIKTIEAMVSKVGE